MIEPYIRHLHPLEFSLPEIDERLKGKLPRKLKKRLKKEASKLKFFGTIENILIEGLHRSMELAQEQVHYEYMAFPEARQEITRQFMEQDIKVEFVPMSEEGQKAWEELSNKWRAKELERELAEYEKLDQYFKEHGVK